MQGPSAGILLHHVTHAKAQASAPRDGGYEPQRQKHEAWRYEGTAAAQGPTEKGGKASARSASARSAASGVRRGRTHAGDNLRIGSGVASVSLSKPCALRARLPWRRGGARHGFGAEGSHTHTRARAYISRHTCTHTHACSTSWRGTHTHTHTLSQKMCLGIFSYHRLRRLQISFKCKQTHTHHTYTQASAHRT